MNEREVKMALRAERKLDEIIERTEDCIDLLEESNRRYEREVRKPDPLPMRRTNLLYWVLVFATFAFLSGAVLQASRAGASSTAETRCVNALVFDVNYSLMSNTTARRHARRWCSAIEENDRPFFKALTQ